MTRYKPDWDSLRDHKIPEWYDRDKFGIFIHWGLYSVPAFAPTTGELGVVPEDEWFINNPYAEWYYNSVNVGKGPTYEHHIKTYGKDFKYEQFADMWKAENWDPNEWADLFKQAGAKYVVLVAKHHDGFCLYDSKYTDFSSVKMGPKRDITLELCEAVRSRGMKFGIYYSPLIDWQFYNEPMYSDWDVHHQNSPTYEYADYAFKQWMELIDKYHPDVLWNDIGWPHQGEHMLPYLFAHYYNTVPEGVTNDRYNGLWHDYYNKEYHQGKPMRDRKWEETRGLGLSFAYNQNESEKEILSAQQLTALLAYSVGNNGNVLMNVGPKADGTIPQIQKDSLLGLGKWLENNGSAIYGTTIDESESIDSGDIKVHFTKNEDTHFAIVEGVTETETEVPGISGEWSALDSNMGVTVQNKSGKVLVNAKNSDGFPVVLFKK